MWINWRRRPNSLSLPAEELAFWVVATAVGGVDLEVVVAVGAAGTKEEIGKFFTIEAQQQGLISAHDRLLTACSGCGSRNRTGCDCRFLWRRGDRIWCRWSGCSLGRRWRTSCNCRTLRRRHRLRLDCFSCWCSWFTPCRCHPCFFHMENQVSVATATCWADVDAGWEYLEVPHPKVVW